jgi:DNA polymerase-3 subunit gamma/tau
MKKLYADLLEHFRNLLVVAMGNRVEKLVDLPSGEFEQLVTQAKPLSAGILNHIFDMLFKAEASIRMSPQPKLALEMTLIRLLQTKPALSIDVLIDKLDALRQEVAPAEPVSKNDGGHPSTEPAVQSAPGGPKAMPEGSGSTADGFAPATEATGKADQMWKQICEIVAQKNPSLAANLIKCRLTNTAEQSLEIDVPDNGFTINMIQREKNMAILNQVCAEIFGHTQNIQLSASNSMGGHNQKKKDNQLKQKAISHPLVADAIEIFDGKLVDVKVL